MTLQQMGIWPKLHLTTQQGCIIKPPAKYTLRPNQIKEMCRLIKDVKLPDGYASNISSCLGKSETTFKNLKSHDCHILLQLLLLVILRGSLCDEIYHTICEVSRFFRELCAKELKANILNSMERSIAITLCKMEKIFPLAFFDIMIHLAIRLPREACLCGPVQYR